MSEIINNNEARVNNLKSLLLDLHNGVSVEETKERLTALMAEVPYGDVVKAEELLIKEGLPGEEIMKFCDLHSNALKGHIDLSMSKPVPPGHPVHTFKMENKELSKLTSKLKDLFTVITNMEKNADASSKLFEIRSIFNPLTDIEKHYLRKENLIFSYLERYEITGPPTVMWGKDNEVRDFLRASHSVLSSTNEINADELDGFIKLVLTSAVNAIDEMIYKEENILFPMCMDTFNNNDWFDIYSQSNEIGYCLYDPKDEWRPLGVSETEINKTEGGRIQLKTGSFNVDELESLFNSIPFDLTFVDKDDNVKYFSHGEERIFQRNRAILGRKVQYCHPPQSVHIVEKILNDFKDGSQSSARFWINFQGKYVLIAYYAVRNEKGEYLGTVEVTQDIQPIKDIQGERRLLSYDK